MRMSMRMSVQVMIGDARLSPSSREELWARFFTRCAHFTHFGGQKSGILDMIASRKSHFGNFCTARISHKIFWPTCQGGKKLLTLSGPSGFKLKKMVLFSFKLV